MIIWTLILSAVAILGDVCLKHSAVSKNVWFLVIGIILYSIDAYFWYLIYKTEKFSTVAVVYSVFTILLSIVLGVLLFHEKISVREIAGILLGISSVALLSL